MDKPKAWTGDALDWPMCDTWPSAYSKDRFYKPSEKTVKGYHRRNRARAEKIAASMKRAFTQFSILGILSLASVTLQAHYA